MDAFSVLDSSRGTAGARELAVRDSNRWTAIRHWPNSPYCQLAQVNLPRQR